jgi:hypothetical protein
VKTTRTGRGTVRAMLPKHATAEPLGLRVRRVTPAIAKIGPRCLKDIGRFWIHRIDLNDRLKKPGTTGGTCLYGRGEHIRATIQQDAQATGSGALRRGRVSAAIERKEMEGDGRGRKRTVGSAFKKRGKHAGGLG